MPAHREMQRSAALQSSSSTQYSHLKNREQSSTMSGRAFTLSEGALAEERGKTVLLSRTRQKISRDGEIRTVADLVTGKVTDGFTMLIDRNMPELTFEAVALRHPDEFEPVVIDAARQRLTEAGVSI